MLEAGVSGSTQWLTEVNAEPLSLKLSVSSAVWYPGVSRKGPAVRGWSGDSRGSFAC